MIDDDPEVQEWFDWQKEELKVLGGSLVYGGIVSNHFLKDPKCMLQIGAALLMEKPIALIVLDGVRIPPKLEQIADKIICVQRSEMGRATKELAEFVREIE